MRFSDSELREMLPKCGRRRFFENGNYAICKEPVIASVVACPSCREAEEEYDSK